MLDVALLSTRFDLVIARRYDDAYMCLLFGTCLSLDLLPLLPIPQTGISDPLFLGTFQLLAP